MCLSIHRYPYNWRTPVGYFVTIVLLGVCFLCEALIYTSVNTVYFGASKFMVAFCEDFKECLARLEAEILKAAKYEQYQPDESRLKLKKMFTDQVQFHCDIIKLAERTSEIYSHIVATFILISGGFWCTNLIEVHLVIDVKSYWL